MPRLNQGHRPFSVAPMKVLAVEHDLDLGEQVTAHGAVQQRAHQVVGRFLHPGGVQQVHEVVDDVGVGD